MWIGCCGKRRTEYIAMSDRELEQRGPAVLEGSPRTVAELHDFLLLLLVPLWTCFTFGWTSCMCCIERICLIPRRDHPDDDRQRTIVTP
jgi:hypothetical protein